MADTFTANYNLTKPEVNASRDTWGTKSNANWDKIDQVLKSLSDTKLNVSGSKTINDSTTFTSTPNVAGKFIATREYADAAAAAAVPSGIIAMWKGLVTDIPTGWRLCNGANGTPDLRDKFIVGVGLSYGPGDYGGAMTHNHGGATGLHNLTVAQMPSHNHTVNDPGHVHGYTDPGHSHVYQGNLSSSNQGYPGAVGTVAAYSIGNYNTTTSQVGITIQGAATGVTINNNGSSAAHSHTIVSADSRPPYFALCFIMKI